MILNKKEDYHVHSNYNDHSSPEMTVKNVIGRAKEIGLKRLAITEHVRKTSDWIPNYLKDIEIQSKGEEIEIIAGFEAKILPDGHIDCLDRYLEDYFIVASIHSKYDAKVWFDAVRKAAQNPNVDVIGHFGPETYWSEALSLDSIAEIASLAANNGKIVEINAKYRRPPTQWLRVLIEHNVKFHLGSDAHSLDEIGQYNGISDLIALAESHSGSPARNET